MAFSLSSPNENGGFSGDVEPQPGGIGYRLRRQMRGELRAALVGGSPAQTVG
jgi:hypothetical protein